MAILQCSELTLVDTIATSHTAAVVDGMRFIVDASSLAVFGAEGAVAALVLYKTNFEK